MTTDATADYLAHWLATHAKPTAHDRRVIEDAGISADDADPGGRNADLAAAAAWWAMVEPESGRWSC